MLCKIENIERLKQQMEQLHKERTSRFEPAFLCAGKDYFGPIRVIKPNKLTRFTSGQKHYEVVFTCFTTRETPLKLAEDLSTDLHMKRGLKVPLLSIQIPPVI